jgi:hypothetical protein
MNDDGSDMTHWTTLRAPLAALFVLALCTGAAAQAPAAAPVDGRTAPAGAADALTSLAQFSWLEGCWRGAVNQREFREHWLPFRGDLLVGAGHTVMDGKTQDYEYLRLEKRADGVYYVTASPGQKEAAYRLVDVTTYDSGDVVYAFANSAPVFPQKISYRRNSQGWLYATVEGKVAGADRQVIYPMRRIGCESGELIAK